MTDFTDNQDNGFGANNRDERLRPALLVVCILSIVAVLGSCFFDFAFYYCSTIPRTDIYQMLSMQGQKFDQQQMDMAIDMFGYAQYHLVFNVLELVGLLFLLFRRFIGFHIYAASQIGFSYVAYLALGLNESASVIFFNLMWVLLYFMLSRYLSTPKEQ